MLKPILTSSCARFIPENFSFLTGTACLCLQHVVEPQISLTALLEYIGLIAWSFSNNGIGRAHAYGNLVEFEDESIGTTKGFALQAWYHGRAGILLLF